MNGPNTVFTDTEMNVLSLYLGFLNLYLDVFW